MTVQNDLAQVTASAGFAGMMAGLFTTFIAAISFCNAIYSVISLFT